MFATGNSADTAGVMMAAEYPENFINTGVRTDSEQRLRDAERRIEEGTRPTKEYFQNLASLASRPSWRG